MKVDVFSPDDKKWSIKAENLQTALQRGARLANVGEKIAVNSPDGKRWNIKTENLQTALQRGAKLASPETKDYLQAGVQGAAKGLGKLADTGVAAANYLGSKLSPGLSYPSRQEEEIDDWSNGGINQGARDQMANTAKDYWQNDKIAKTISDPLDTGMNYDRGIQVSQAGGEAASSILPFAAGAKGIQLATKAGGIAKLPWIDKFNKLLATPVNARNAAVFGASGSATEALKDDGILTQVIGSIVAGGAVSAASTQPLYALYKLATKPLETTKDVAYTGIAKAFGGNLRTEGIEAAEREGIQLLPNEVTDSGIAAFLRNNVTESAFASRVYKEVVANSPKKLIENLETSLDAVGTKLAGTETESALATGLGQYKSYLTARNSEWRANSTRLYDAASGLTQSTELVTPVKAKAALNKEFNKIKANVEYVGERKVLEENVKNLKDIFDNRKVSVGSLIEDIKKLNVTIGDSYSYKSLLTPIVKAIESDIDTLVTNKEFVKNWRIAKSYNKMMIQERLNVDISRSILEGRISEEALSYMGSAGSIKELGHIIGTDLKGKVGENARLLMDSLKRAKLETKLSQSNVVNRVTNEFNTTAFLNLFENTANEDLLRALMGRNYDVIRKNTTPIARAIEEGRRSSYNPSKGSVIGKDLGIIFSGIVAAANANPAGLAAAVGAAGGINILSRIMADPALTKKIIEQGKKVKAPGKSILERGQNVLKSTPVKATATNQLRENYGLELSE